MKSEIELLVKVTETSCDVEAEKQWILTECERLGLPILKELANRSAKNRELSYSPYSHYRVGSSILAESGQIGDGANIEIVTFSETGHAEEQAAKGLVMMGEIQLSGRRFIKAVAVCHEGDSAPCCRCRQILLEFCDNCLVIVVNPKGEIRRITSLKILTNEAFTPSALGID